MPDRHDTARPGRGLRELRVAGRLREPARRQRLALLVAGAARRVDHPGLGGLGLLATHAHRGGPRRAVGVDEQPGRRHEAGEPARPVLRDEILRRRRAVVGVEPPRLDEHGALVEHGLGDRLRRAGAGDVRWELEPGLLARQAEVSVESGIDAALAATEVDEQRLVIRTEDLLAPQHERVRHELEARADLEPEHVHVDVAEALRVRVATEVRVDPHVEIEVGVLERRELLACRRPAREIDRQRAKVPVVGQRRCRPVGDAIVRREHDEERQEAAHGTRDSRAHAIVKVAARSTSWQPYMRISPI